jgi:NitT/TauT family transport system ATP-binding protein
VTSGAAFVELDRVGLTYAGGTRALDGVTMRLKRGEFAAVVGPSGCGKSSLMKLTTGLVRPSEGAIAVSGREVAGPLGIVGMAFQNPTLLPWRSTLENVMLPLEIVEPHRSRLRRHRRAYEEKAMALLASVGLAEFASRQPWQLSGGMQQRASLCRALIHEPDLLMLDEPFGALDAFTREELWGVLQEVWMQRRFTVILVTHDLREAVFLADTVHVMSNRPGRIVASHGIGLPRPRGLETTFTPEFVGIVHLLRDQISAVRAGRPLGRPASPAGEVA